LSADTSDFDRAMDRSDGKTSKWKTATRGALLGVGAAATGLGFAIKAGFSEFTEAERVTAQTRAVLKSTGGAANVTAGEIDKLATSLMKKSGVDDEAIKSGENMLLTFTKVRNETGKGNDIFNQATKATLDLSVALGKDMPGAALLVGKALNDPIKGMTSLTRAGIQFTDAQKESIKQMVKHGNTAGAQKLILKELQTQFGGSAEAAGKTFGGQMNIAKQTMLNFAGEAVGKAIPVIKELAGWISEHIVPAIRDFISNVQGHGPELRKMWDDMQPAIRAVGKLLRDVVAPVLEFVFFEVLPRAIPIVVKLVTVLARIIEIAADVVTALVDFGREIGDAGQKTADAIGDIVTWFTGLPGKVVDAIVGLPGKVWDVIKNIGSTITAAAETILGWGRNVGGKIKDGAVNGITGIATGVWNIINNIGEVIVGFAQSIVGWGTGIGTKIKEGATAGVVGIATGVWNVVNNIGAAIAGFAQTILGWGANIGSTIKDGAVNGITGIASAVWNVVNNIKDVFAGFKDTVIGWGKSIGNWIKDGVLDIVRGIPGAVAGAVKGIPGAIGGLVGLGGNGPVGSGGRVPPPVGPPGGAPGGVGGSGPSSLQSSMWDEYNLARSMISGWSDMGTYNPASRLPSGRPSDHAVYPAKAFDAGFSPAIGWAHSSARRFFAAMIGRPGIHYAILGDKIWSREQGLHGYSAGGHMNHVHVSGYDQGGWLKPGLTLAYNNTGQPERVLAPGQVGNVTFNFHGPVAGSKRALVDLMREAYAEAARTTPGAVWSTRL
jgi:hypothetical protein